MLKIAVPQNDQSIYELTTESGKKYFVRCPGQAFDEGDNDGMVAFLVEGGGERPVMLREMHKIVSFIRRPDLPIPENANCLSSMLDIFTRRPGHGAYNILSFHLE